MHWNRPRFAGIDAEMMKLHLRLRPRQRGGPIESAGVAMLVDEVEHRLAGCGDHRPEGDAHHLPAHRRRRVAPRGARSPGRELRIAHRVIFTGRRDDVPAVTAALDVAVLPSYREAQGLSILEAMALSRPVIASNVGGIPEMIEDGRTGLLVEPHDADALAAGIAPPRRTTHSPTRSDAPATTSSTTGSASS